MLGLAFHAAAPLPVGFPPMPDPMQPGSPDPAQPPEPQGYEVEGDEGPSDPIAPPPIDPGLSGTGRSTPAPAARAESSTRASDAQDYELDEGEADGADSGPGRTLPREAPQAHAAPPMAIYQEEIDHQREQFHAPQDTPCAQCGEDVGQRELSSTCPKCGQRVGLSVSPDLLRFSEPGWLEGVVGGLGLLTAGGAALVAFSFLVFGLQAWSTSATPKLPKGVEAPTPLLIVMLGALGSLGLHLLLAYALERVNRPQGVSADPSPRPGWLVPAILCGALGSVLYACAVSDPSAPWRLGVTLGQPLSLAYLPVLVWTFARLSRLAARVPNPGLAQQARVISVALPAALLAAQVHAMLPDGPDRGMLLKFVGLLISFIAGAGLLATYAWGLATLLVLRIELSRCAVAARTLHAPTAGK